MELSEEEKGREKIDRKALNRLTAKRRETGWIVILNWAVYSTVEDEGSAKNLITALARKLAEHYDPAPLIEASAHESD